MPIASRRTFYPRNKVCVCVRARARARARERVCMPREDARGDLNSMIDTQMRAVYPPPGARAHTHTHTHTHHGKNRTKVGEIATKMPPSLPVNRCNHSGSPPSSPSIAPPPPPWGEGASNQATAAAKNGIPVAVRAPGACVRGTSSCVRVCIPQKESARKRARERASEGERQES